MASLDPVPLSNLLGFASLILYCLTLLPTLIRVIFPRINSLVRISRWLLSQRRTVGIGAFLFALGHGILLVNKRYIDFTDIVTSWIYIQGIFTFLIFALLTVTSNNWSIKSLGKNWKRLHRLTYIAMFLLTWHILDKMMGHWTQVTPAAITIILTIDALFIIRKWIELRHLRCKIYRLLTFNNLHPDNED